MKKNTGFTLVELLIVMMIMGTVGLVAVGTFAGALRGGNKGNSVNDVRQNGDYILNQMSKSISYAESFEGVSTDGTTYVGTEDASCITGQAYSYIKIRPFNADSDIIYSCQANTIASNSGSLIDTTSLKVTGCNFYCTWSGTSFSPTIDITFTLSTLGNLAENKSSVDFETSVKPRNQKAY